jgi:hypothetical protein
MVRKPLYVTLVLSALAAVTLALPAAANASDSDPLPPNCYKHPITGEVLCVHPPR